MVLRQLRRLEYDFTAGLVVFLVAIPLCLGIALASGAPLMSGIIAGIVGGIVVGILSESSVSVSGPAAGMVTVVLAGIAQLGGFDAFLLALFLAGFLQMIIGSLRAGFIADYIPSNVIQGLLCAIGFLIILKQIPFALTYASDGSALMSAFKETSETFSLAPLEDISSHINYGAFFISIISMLLLIFFDKTKNKYLKSIPGPVVVVILGTLINEFFAYAMPDLMQFSEELVNIPIQKDFTSFLSQLSSPDWSQWKNPHIYYYACVIAAVASLEALLNLEAIEKIDNVRRYCSRNRELFAQGVGNTISGLLGGLPITSVVVRSSVNLQAGGKTKLATIFHGTLILLTVVLIPHWINRIPLAALAAILIYVGFKLTKPSIYVGMHQQGFARFFPFIITTIAIVSTNLLLGVLIGLFFSFFFILRDNSRTQIDIINEKHPSGIIKRLVLPQHVSFLRKASLVAELESIPKGTHLIIDARYAEFIDNDVLEVIQVFSKTQAPAKNIALNLVGFKKSYEIHDRVEFVNVTTFDAQSALQPKDVLDILKEGNQRFLNEECIHRNLLDDVKATSTTQHPIAIVIGCIDSRVPIETIFDMGVGDVFVVRVAGNVCNNDIVGSVEFACQNAGAKLIMVLGHSYCGAIKAACDGVKASGQLSHLLEKINPAIEAEKETTTHRDSENHDFVSNVTKLNVGNTLKQIYENSASLRDLINNKSVGLIGAVYNIETGKVHFDTQLYGQA